VTELATRSAANKCRECRKSSAEVGCDWVLVKTPLKRCGFQLCGSCAMSPATDKHLCKPHMQRWLLKLEQKKP
jgi:hypothetical protein